MKGGSKWKITQF